MRGMYAIVLIGLIGCNSILGIGELATAPDAPNATPGEPSDVQGSDADVFHVTGTTTALKPRDLTTTTLQAYVPDDSAMGFRIIDVDGKADGTFMIPGVPAGPYMLLQQGRFVFGFGSGAMWLREQSAAQHHIVSTGFAFNGVLGLTIYDIFTISTSVGVDKGFRHERQRIIEHG